MQFKIPPLVITAILFISAALPAVADEPPVVAVFELRTKDVENETMLQYIDALSGALFRTGRVTVVDAGRRNEALKEIEFSTSIAADEKAQISIGRQLAATLIVTGSFGRYGEKLVVTLRVVETSTGRVLGSSDEVYKDLDDLFKDTDDIAEKLLSSVAPRQAKKGTTTVSKQPRSGSDEASGPATAEESAPVEIIPSTAPLWTPFQFSIWAPLQLMPKAASVFGLRVGIVFADNMNVYGLDTGLINSVEKKMVGVQAGVLNFAGTVIGIQAGIIGFAETVYVLQANPILNRAESVAGMQTGLVNLAEKCIGVQIGLVNIAGLLKGFQLGLVNIVKYGEAAGFMPIANVRF